ncbi:hypothetical protein GRJ2_001413100 [Grus japonensis]|uniref:Uncharacterized protein n=1 Tax=Grus japonensis TaxID=30415 RepID=A0ABC9WVK5_GRUJA
MLSPTAGAFIPLGFGPLSSHPGIKWKPVGRASDVTAEEESRHLDPSRDLKNLKGPKTIFVTQEANHKVVFYDASSSYSSLARGPQCKWCDDLGNTSTANINFDCE